MQDTKLNEINLQMTVDCNKQNNLDIVCFSDVRNNDDPPVRRNVNNTFFENNYCVSLNIIRSKRNISGVKLASNFKKRIS